MQEITKIVVPLDLGEHTRKLVDFALYITNKRGGTFLERLQNVLRQRRSN